MNGSRDFVLTTKLLPGVTLFACPSLARTARTASSDVGYIRMKQLWGAAIFQPLTHVPTRHHAATAATAG